MASSNQKALTVLKIVMEVLYVLFIIACIYLIVRSSIALSDTVNEPKDLREIREEQWCITC
ncbi:unnamed protein product, partial [Medioppia subpectinata]